MLNAGCTQKSPSLRRKRGRRCAYGGLLGGQGAGGTIGIRAAVDARAAVQDDRGSVGRFAQGVNGITLAEEGQMLFTFDTWRDDFTDRGIL